MAAAFVMLFDTAIGRCAIAWGDRGILSLNLPDADDDKTLARLRRRTPDAHEITEGDEPPETIMAVIARIRALAEGRTARFDDVELDMGEVSPFERDVLELTRRIGPGETRTYGEIALELGDIGLSRRVGQALGRNPFPIIVPCHRVVGAGGTMTGFSAPGGTDTKRKLLKIEGAIGPDLFDLLDG